MSAPAESTTSEKTTSFALSGATAAVAASLVAALALTWWRLFRGADLVDEAFAVLVPWRWALGDRPFVDEQNLTQSAGLLAYPFVKLFALVRGGDVAGLVLYERHLYLALAVIVAGCVFVLARKSLSASLAALVAAPFVTVVLFETPQLTANTLGALLLVAGAALGAVAVLGGGRRWALAAGIAFGLACVAYPTVLLLMPFVAVFLAFSVGERTVVMVARGSFLHPPPGELEPSGARAWRVLSAWALGGFLVVLPVGALVLAPGRARPTSSAAGTTPSPSPTGSTSWGAPPRRSRWPARSSVSSWTSGTSSPPRSSRCWCSVPAPGSGGGCCCSRRRPSG